MFFTYPGEGSLVLYSFITRAIVRLYEDVPTSVEIVFTSLIFLIYGAGTFATTTAGVTIDCGR